MKLSDGIDGALDARENGTIRVTDGAAKAEVTVVDADRLGVRIRRLNVHRGVMVDVKKAAAALPRSARNLHEPIVPIEVDQRHQRALLRTAPDEMRDREFFEVEVEGGGQIDVQRFKVDEDGQRDRVDWTMTRDQLGRLLDELAMHPR